MRITSFRTAEGIRYGAVDAAGGIRDLRAADPELPEDLNDALQVLVGYRADLETLPAVDPASITPLPTIPHPRKIICIGVNYLDHAAETGSATPPYPTVFGKFGNALIAAGDPIIAPRTTTQLDYEGELGVVIGRKGKYVAAEDAYGYVAGYLAVNDVSARDFQGHTSQWIMGKSGDTFAPIGPALITADEIADPHDLRLRTVVSGEVLQDASTADMIFKIPDLIAYLSQTMTLLPGDIIATGTPAGIGAARTPQRFLVPGDTVTVTITGLPDLTNTVIADSAAAS
jgi:2-keto-4-pentenoate hydratase/2-oxohepta-3-ene-1,7-dioic acid hydratase in catechol pathway